MRGGEKCRRRKKFYITTPIYYPSDKLHIGHSYSTVATDAMARYKRLKGYDVMFLTGTDEHGQKIEEKATEKGVTPQQFVDQIVEGPRGVKDLWKLMDISYDRFIRTTDDYHVAAIQKIFKKMYDKGDIYKGTYKGKYCTPCESFWTESQLVNGCCPDCGRPVVDAEEEAYFFRLCKVCRPACATCWSNTDFLEPRSRVNEMVHNFIDPGLEDLCVSRTSVSWGVPVDFDPGHVVYVWIDALFNYTTALGFMNDRYPENDYEKYWPADVHFVGKEIVRFHSIIWPAMLMSMDLPLPKKVYGHGWLLLDGGKMSKSKGNVVDPYLLAERYSTDALRYFLLRDFPFGSDGNFSNELLIGRINMDLANDLGNLLSRTTAMADKYFGGALPAAQDEGPEDAELLAMLGALRDKYEAQMEKFSFQSALAEVFSVIARANKYIDETAPWVLAKDEAKKPRLARGAVQPGRDAAAVRGAADAVYARHLRRDLCADRRGRGRADLGQRRRRGRPARSGDPAQGQKPVSAHRRGQRAGRAGGAESRAGGKGRCCRKARRARARGGGRAGGARGRDRLRRFQQGGDAGGAGGVLRAHEREQKAAQAVGL